MDALPPDLQRAVRALAAQPRALVALDFDGCLAPIVADPQDARPLPEASDALRRLAATPGTTVALVSGRPLDALRQLAAPPAAALLVGSHGAEFGGGALGSTESLPRAEGLDGGAPRLGPQARHLLDRVTAALQGIVRDHPGAALELKPTSAVLHTRRAERAEAAAATAAALAGPAGWPGVHVLQGKEVVEISVSDATKGAALRRLREVALADGEGGVLYAGDDVTDERAFAVLDDDAGDVTVKVGDGETLARHRVPDPVAVARLLQFLLELRAAEVRSG
ncbi:MAG TPA: trehalose-phosphatase [Kineosporiaceae bacterium]